MYKGKRNAIRERYGFRCGYCAIHENTELGAIYIRALRLNRPALVAHRQENLRIEALQKEQQELLAKLTRLDERIEALKAHIADIGRVQPEES